MRREVIGDCELWLGRAEDVLPTLSGIDQIVTSPPYNLGNTSGGGSIGKRLGHYSLAAGLGAKRGGGGKWSGGALANGYGSCTDDLPHERYVAWQHEILRLCWAALSDDGAIYYNHKPRILNGALVSPLDYNPGLPVRQIVIWARAGGVNFSPAFYLPTHEWVVIFAKHGFRLRDKAASGAGDVWYIPQETGTDHPAPFPIALPLRAIETTAAELVCDPFCGSGTTGVACARLGRRFIGVELDPTHYETALRRIEAAYRQPRLFAEPAPRAEQLELVA
jgi:site-specific DNA-methyltransferase (adenine-specific)